MHDIFIFAILDSTRLWYALPIIASVSLVYSGTRHERMGEILRHAITSAIWMGGLMAVIMAAFWFFG